MGDETYTISEAELPESEARGRVMDASAELAEQVIEYQAKKFTNGSVLTLLEQDWKLNGPSDWVLYITKYATFWMMKMNFMDHSHEMYKQFRKSMVKVGALAVVAIIWADRKLATLETEDSE